MGQKLTVKLPRPLRAVRVLPPGHSAPAAAPDEGQTQALARQALEAERQELAQARQALVQGLAQLGPLREDLRRQAEGQLVELALEIAQKVMMQQIESGSYQIEPIVAEALRQAPTRAGVVVRLNPGDCQRCRQGLGEQAEQETEVRFVADPAVSPAQCVLEMADGTIDSSPQQRLEEVAAVLRQAE